MTVGWDFFVVYERFVSKEIRCRVHPFMVHLPSCTPCTRPLTGTVGCFHKTAINHGSLNPYIVVSILTLFPEQYFCIKIAIITFSSLGELKLAARNITQYHSIFWVNRFVARYCLFCLNVSALVEQVLGRGVLVERRWAAATHPPTTSPPRSDS